MSVRMMGRLAAATLLLLPLTACPGNVPGATNPPSGITGSVVKGTAPFPNATVVLIRKVSNESQDQEVKTSDANGSFSFANVPPGTYRVAFDRATPDERKTSTSTNPLKYQAATDTYGYYSTNEFNLGSGEARQIPQMNVSWAANLQPAPNGSASAPVTFSWAAAPGATSYKVRIANLQNNTIYTSPSLSGTSFTWDGKTASGTNATAGQYLWSVNVDGANFLGGTNLSPFTLQ